MIAFPHSPQAWIRRRHARGVSKKQRFKKNLYAKS
jgi:hypothetical protein